MSLVETAHSSIAFNTAVAEKLNAKASSLDPRLFCFAYYEPNPLPSNVDSFTIFHIAVLNIYGLLWDCGPMLINKIFSNPIYTVLGRDIIKMKQCRDFFFSTRAIRIDICHNNSEKLFFNSILKNMARNYIEKYFCINKQSIDWDSICNAFFNECKNFVQELDNLINQSILKNDTKLKQEWLDAISIWYKQNDEFFMHVLADKYKLKNSHKLHEQNKIITKIDVKDWINNTQNSVAQSYESYWEKCKSRIESLLIAKNCPKPAFPLEFFHQITRDVHNF